MNTLTELKHKTKNLLSDTPLRDILETYRHTGLKKNDVFLISYQNSGSNWLRNLIYESITGKNPNKKLGKEDARKRFPVLGNHKKAKQIKINKEKIRLIKSHSPFRGEYNGKKVVYLVRDPRDVVVSKYKKKLKKGYNIKSKNKEIKKFVQGKLMSEGKWNQHVRSWLNASKQGKIDLCLVRYVDLKKNTEKELKKIMDFLNANRAEKNIRQAIKDNKIEKMRKSNFRARKGQPGNWRKELNKNQARKIKQEFKKTMEKLSYIK